MRKLIALDLAGRVSWAVRAADGGIVPGSDSFRSPYSIESPAFGFWRFRNFLALACHEGKLEAVFYIEGDARAHRAWLPHLEKACEGAGVILRSVPGTVKKAVTGKGSASKAAVIEAVRKLGHEVTDDEAAAVALLLYAEKAAA
jgi:hypothetical protein